MLTSTASVQAAEPQAGAVAHLLRASVSQLYHVPLPAAAVLRARPDGATQLAHKSSAQRPCARRRCLHRRIRGERFRRAESRRRCRHRRRSGRRLRRLEERRPHSARRDVSPTKRYQEAPSSVSPLLYITLCTNALLLFSYPRAPPHLATFFYNRDKWIQSGVIKKIQQARESPLVGPESVTEVLRPDSEVRDNKPKTVTLARTDTIALRRGRCERRIARPQQQPATSAIAKFERQLTRKGSLMTKIFGFGGHHHKHEKPVIQSTAPGAHSVADRPAPPLPPRDDKKSKSPSSKQKLKPIEAPNPAQQPRTAEPLSELEIEFQKRKISGHTDLATPTPTPFYSLAATSTPLRPSASSLASAASPSTPSAPAAEPQTEPATTSKHKEEQTTSSEAQLTSPSPVIVLSPSTPEPPPVVGEGLAALQQGDAGSRSAAKLRTPAPKSQRARTPSPPRAPRQDALELTSSLMRKSLSADDIDDLADESVSFGRSSHDTLLNEGDTGAARPSTLHPPELVTSSISAESTEEAADSSLPTPDFSEEQSPQAEAEPQTAAAAAGVTFLGARKRPSVDLLGTLHEEAENENENEEQGDALAGDASAASADVSKSPEQPSKSLEPPHDRRAPRVTAV